MLAIPGPPRVTPLVPLPGQPRSIRAQDSGFMPREGFEAFRPGDAEQSIADRFCRVALKRSEATAVVDGETTLSYRALWLSASGIASALTDVLGARHGPVVLSLGTSVAAIEALLGVLLAGRPYMFLDPSLPDAEAARILAAAAPAAVVVDGAPATAPGGIVALRFEDLIRQGVAAPVAPRTEPQDLACLFCTSGSTGAPKLVGLSHRAVMFDIGRQTNDLYLGPDDRFDLLFSPAFSASLSSIFTALLTGGQLHLFDVRDRLTMLGPWLERSGISVSTMTVSTLRTLCCAVESGRARPTMRLVSVGGEPLLPSDVARFHAAFAASCVLQNAMASTETRTYAQYFVQRDSLDENVVPIGWPVFGKELVLLGEDGRVLVEPGQPGEIAVRSRYLADGYINDPELTARRFVRERDGATLFRTGDRGQIRDDGSVVFLGRTDSLVKIRGYRVELDAIERVLSGDPRISQVAVVVQNATHGETAIAAFATPRVGAHVTADDLRARLAGALPPYAVPASIVLLESLPVTRNGKVDRQALSRRRSDHARGLAPEGRDTVSSLTEIWTEVLQRPGIGLRESFFECGGDSLNALRLQLSIHERLGADLPLDVLVARPTIERLADWLDNAGTSGESHSVLVPLQPEGAGVPLFCLPGIGGEPMRYEPLARHLGTGRPVYGLRAAGVPEGGGDSITIEAMATDYLARLDAVLTPEQPVHLCGHSLGGLVAFEMARQLRVAGRCVGLLAIIDTPLGRGHRRHLPGRALDLATNFPGWIAYDAMESGWRNLAVRCRGKAEVAGQRVLAKLTGHPRREGLNMRAYFGTLHVPARFQQAVNARYAAARRYVHHPYDGAITLFRARAQSLTGPSDRHLGWSGLALEGVEVFDVPGHHDSCVSEPHVRHLADVLRMRLEEVDR
jgi:amino acid adenylation domain-containing protein